MSAPAARRQHSPAAAARPARPVPASGWREALAERDNWLLVPLRAFLGLTFLYAGLQKLADRWFFKASAPASIQSQLRGAARTSPIGGVVAGLAHHAVLLGLLIAFAEIAIGLATLVGLWARPAAATGLLLSLGFLLTVSWHSRPYYYGADVVFVFAWTPLVLGGAGRLSLDALAAQRARSELRLPPYLPVSIGFATVQQVCGYYDRGRCTAQRGRRCGPQGCPVLAPTEPVETVEALDRRTFATRAGFAGWAAVSVVLAGGFAAVAGRLIGPRHRSPPPPALSAPAGGPPGPSSDPGGSAATTSPAGTSPAGTSPAGTSPAGTSPATAPAAPSTAPPATAAPVAGTRIGASSAVPVGGAASFTDPGTGDPAYVLQPARGRFIAFDATCTHQGCPVQFAGSTFQCPCHGAAFDATTGAVLRGPATRPLAAIHIQEGPDGQLYAV